MKSSLEAFALRGFRHPVPTCRKELLSVFSSDGAPLARTCRAGFPPRALSTATGVRCCRCGGHTKWCGWPVVTRLQQRERKEHCFNRMYSAGLFISRRPAGGLARHQKKGRNEKPQTHYPSPKYHISVSFTIPVANIHIRNNKNLKMT